MKSRLLGRLLRKNLGVTTREELEALVSALPAETQTNFLSFIDATDQAITDLDKTIEIRDRTLAISSKEMTVLNTELANHANRQETILGRLQATVNLLGEDANREADLEKLVESVSKLVQTQIKFLKFQKAIYEEGIRICSAMSIKHLESQVKSSFEALSETKLELAMYFCGDLFEEKDSIEFYQCDAKNQPIDSQRLSSLKSSSTARFIHVESPSGNGVLAVIYLSSQGDLSQISAQTSPLLPSIAATVENIKLLSDEKHKQHLENELNTIRLVQNTLLPPVVPKSQTPDLEVNGFYESATECGGDWWTYFDSKSGRHVILVGDVTGHGTGSAMVCAVVKGYCDSLIGRDNLQVSQILSELNLLVCRMAQDTNRAMTMSAVSIDTRNGVATFANAGHPLPYLLSKSPQGALCKPVRNVGAILGMSPDAQYPEISFTFRPEDKLIFYSDGLTEARGIEDHMYGTKRLKNLILGASQNCSAKDLNRAIVEDVRRFIIRDRFDDDVTIVIARNTRSAD